MEAEQYMTLRCYPLAACLSISSPWLLPRDDERDEREKKTCEWNGVRMKGLEHLWRLQRKWPFSRGCILCPLFAGRWNRSTGSCWQQGLGVKWQERTETSYSKSILSVSGETSFGAGVWNVQWREWSSILFDLVPHSRSTHSTFRTSKSVIINWPPAVWTQHCKHSGKSYEISIYKNGTTRVIGVRMCSWP